MKEQKKQPRKIRFSDEELSLIKNTFADNEEILILLRKLFLQIPLNTNEVIKLNEIRANVGVKSILRKTFLPTIDVTAPLHQMIDLWMTVDIKEKSLEQAELNLVARGKLIAYLEQQLSFIEKGAKESILIDGHTKIKIATIADKKNMLTNFLMRNTLLGHIEQQLQQLVFLAGSKDETTEQTLKRLAQDSTK